MNDLAHDRLTLQPEIHAPLTARRWLLAYLASAGLDRLRDEALLVVSELVTNAVTYSPGPVTVEVGLNAGGLAIFVTDQSATPPSLSDHADPYATCGRGLQLVAAVADRWGYDPNPDHGKTVWAQLATHSFA